MGKVINGINPSLQWSDVLEMINDSRIDSVGLNERVNSLATRSIKRDSKLEALNMIVSMCDLTTLEGEDTEGKISQMVAKAIKPDPLDTTITCLLYTSPSPRDATLSRMPSSA